MELTRDNCILLLIDIQPKMLEGVKDDDVNEKLKHIMKVVKTAAIYDLLVVMTSIDEHINGKFLPEITKLLPKTMVIERKVPSFNALEDDNVASAIDKFNKPNVVVIGLWTSMCMAFSCLDLKLSNYEVYGLMDCCGDATKIAHKYGIKRMIQAGIEPITWMPFTSYIMHDWNDVKAGKIINQVFK